MRATSAANCESTGRSWERTAQRAKWPIMSTPSVPPRPTNKPTEHESGHMERMSASVTDLGIQGYEAEISRSSASVEVEQMPLDPVHSDADDEDGPGNSGSGWTVLNVMNNVIGSGLLAMPFALQSCSIVIGVLLLCIYMIAGGLSVILLAQSCDMAGSFVYRDLGAAAFGPRAGVPVSVLMLINTNLAAISYVVIIGDTLPHAAQAFSSGVFTDLFDTRAKAVVIVAVVLLFPMSLVRDLSGLSAASLLALAISLFTIIFTVYEAVRQHRALSL
eukprot:SAG11_NODE_1557_length_4684_cov_3.766194_2_plen_275_part_00